MGATRSPLPLVERSEGEIARAIVKRVQSIRDVRGVGQPKLRLSGKRVRIELPVSLEENLGFEQTHEVGLRIEREVKKIIPYARVILRTEPFKSNLENTWDLISKIIEGMPGTRGVTNIHLQKVDGHLTADVNVEVSADMTLKQAYAVSQEVEKRIKASDPNISEVSVHVETASDRLGRESTAAGTELKLYIAHVAQRSPEIKKLYGVRVRKIGNRLYVVLRCRFAENLTMGKNSESSSELERLLRPKYPEISQIVIKKMPV
jgi:divalent metal cation (Fe/Co/Zn/Cd) transporter